ncbi:MAG: lamin tail domain-containing protein, partial [Thermoplasmata archaeon]|nr:lamin tail domain-containing protein [Thermoplasmata archaeon]
LLLTAEDGTPVDYIAWSSGSSVDPPPEGVSWEGEMEAEEGFSLSLIPDGADTNTSEGWFVTWPTPGYSNIPVETDNFVPFISPDSSLSAAVSAVQKAETEIKLQLFSVSNYVLVEEIADALDRGVEVKALLHKEHPIPIFDNYTLYAAVNWSKRGAEVKELETENENSLMIIDGKKAVYITSNWSSLTFPGDVSFGKRAWGLSFENKTAVDILNSRFLEEWNNSQVFALDGNGSLAGDFPDGDYPAPFKELVSYTMGTVQPLFFPGDQEKILSLVRDAEHRVYLETDDLPFENDTGINPMVELLANLSMRGMDIRVVLSNGRVEKDNRSAAYLSNAGAQVHIISEFGLNKNQVRMDGALLMVDNYTILSSGFSLYGHPSTSANGLLIGGPPSEKYRDFFERDFYFSIDFERTTPHHLLITEVYYNTYSGGSDEYIALFNQGKKKTDLSGYILTDGETEYVIENLALSSGETVYLARNPEVFLHLTSIETFYTYFLSLSNEKDSVSLFDPEGNIVDSVAWGGEIVKGLNGEKLWAWEGELASVGKGQVIRRNREGGLYADTNGPDDWQSHRIFMVGQSDLPFTSFNFTGEVTAFVSPDSSFEAIHRELENASVSIYLNVYQITNLYLMEDLLSARNRSVEVKVFLEGGPVGGVPDSTYYIAHRLAEAGAEVSFLHNNKTVKDRYNYDHAKYAVIDHDTLILDSENWKDTGIPVDPTFGNRGWGIVVRNQEVAQYFEMVFNYDSDPVFNDVVMFGSDPRYQPPEDFTPDYSIPEGTYKPRFPAGTFSGEFEITPVIAPDHTLRKDAIIGMIDQAQETVYIEQLQCHISWGEEIPNLFLEAAIRAAGRGCDVRILLDSRYVIIGDSKLDNADTVEYINDIALTRGLDNLRARLAVLKGFSKIHNKGVIVDGEYTLISSINWGKGAALLNREAGVIVRNQEVAEYYTEVFLYDWSLTESKDEGNGVDEISPAYYLSAIFIIAGVIVGIIVRRRK